MKDEDQIIIRHYEEQAKKLGASNLSTMPDEIVREAETDVIRRFVKLAQKVFAQPALNLLDLGCGNGHLLQYLSNELPEPNYHGIDYSHDMLAIAKQRNMSDVVLSQGDARNLTYDDGHFDVVYTQRCLINILDETRQAAALSEIHRVLKPGGLYLMIEAFMDGLENNNLARTQLGLEPLKEAYHNRYFRPKVWQRQIQGLFQTVRADELVSDAPELCFASNFLSSHYFMARVVYPAVTQAEVTWNTEFVKFFSFLPPMGNYSCIQAYILKKI